MQAILSNAQHPEYGEVTIPFPIGENEYGRCLELLGKMEIGNPIERDCFIREIQHGPSILQQLVGCNMTVDELDYLAKRLDSFDDRETAKFQGAAVRDRRAHQPDLFLSAGYHHHGFFRFGGNRPESLYGSERRHRQSGGTGKSGWI